jgi:hypothetical protein
MPVFQGKQGDRKRDPSSRRPAGRHIAHRRYGQLPGQLPHDQIPADAMVPAAAPISCSKSAAPASTARSVPASASCSRPSIPPQSLPWRPDSQSLDAPFYSRRKTHPILIPQPLRDPAGHTLLTMPPPIVRQSSSQCVAYP